MLFDTHAHYFDSRFDGQADEILATEVFGKEIGGVINAATNPENALCAIEQAARFSGMYVAVGIHPEDCKPLSDDVAAEVNKIRALADSPEKRSQNKIVAIGEIGLDYYWEPVEAEKQARFFEAQLILAEELGLPVVIHDREAHGDVFETLLRHPAVTGVMHSYSGSAEMAKELVRRGWYISFSGVLTFKNAKKVREVARTVPRDRVLLETDAPYLSPEPYRGKLNHSGRVPLIAAELARLWEMPYEEVVQQTTENAKRLFGIE